MQFSFTWCLDDSGYYEGDAPNGTFPTRASICSGQPCEYQRAISFGKVASKGRKKHFNLEVTVIISLHKCLTMNLHYCSAEHNYLNQNCQGKYSFISLQFYIIFRIPCHIHNTARRHWFLNVFFKIALMLYYLQKQTRIFPLLLRFCLW